MRLGLGDEKRAEEVLLHPAVFPFLFDDLGTEQFDSDSIRVGMGDPGIYILSPAPGTIFIAHSLFSAAYEVYQAALPEVRGAGVIAAGKAAIRWMFEWVPDCDKLVGLVPAMNFASIASARRMGFVVEGRIARAYRKGGALHDVVVLGMNRTTGGG